MRVVVLVPRRAGIADRDRLWEYVSEWWATYHPDWPVYVGESPDGPFNQKLEILFESRSGTGEMADTNYGIDEIRIFGDWFILTSVDTCAPNYVHPDGVLGPVSGDKAQEDALRECFQHELFERDMSIPQISEKHNVSPDLVRLLLGNPFRR